MENSLLAVFGEIPCTMVFGQLLEQILKLKIFLKIQF